MPERLVRFIFVLGRPGCGKSYLFNNVFGPALSGLGKARVQRYDDFPVLEELLSEDREFKKHVRKDGGFEVTDWTVIDDVLKRMELKLRNTEADFDKIFVEFARADYRMALRNFSSYIRERALLMYIYSPFELCLESNKNRYEHRVGNEDKDDHIVPEDLMNSYYKADDIEQLYLEDKKVPPKVFYGWNLIVFDNSMREMSPTQKQEIFMNQIREYRL